MGAWKRECMDVRYVTQVLREYMQEHEIHHARMMVSPFFRTRETAAKILEECGDYITHGVSESPLLVEQVCQFLMYCMICSTSGLFRKQSHSYFVLFPFTPFAFLR